MTVFHVVQLVLMAAVAALAIERCRALCFTGAIDAAPLRRALVRLLRRGQLDRAQALLAAARPAFAVGPAWALVDPALGPAERVGRMDEEIFDLDARATRGLRALRIAASVASAIGFIGAAIEIHWVFNGEHGLMRLQAGLVESIGMSRAFLSMAIGIATSSFALGSLGVLRKAARDLCADGRRLLASVEDALETAERRAAGADAAGADAA